MNNRGQALVLTCDQFADLMAVIQRHRHPEKNTAIVQISFKLGLSVQEIAGLQIRDVAELSPAESNQCSFTLKDVLALPDSKLRRTQDGGQAPSRSPCRRIIFSLQEFTQVVRRIEAMAKSGAKIYPEAFYPAIKPYRGHARKLLMTDAALRQALENHLRIRSDKEPIVSASSPLFLTQKGGPYSPNTLQKHLALILRRWAGLAGARSQSGRRTLLANVLEEQGKSITCAQQIAGHVNPSTTLGYMAPAEESIEDALEAVWLSYSERHKRHR